MARINWFQEGFDDGHNGHTPRRDASDQASYDIGFLMGSDKRHEEEDVRSENVQTA